jgi:hypothetical protein
VTYSVAVDKVDYEIRLEDVRWLNVKDEVQEETIEEKTPRPRPM